ncbi:MAG: FkbM family methyltransferase [Thermaerobacter sp.]|nr:FkbM family methyltransferase [Thermaerobacter sp.]
MTFTSYAQNFEDVMLWRALKHIQNGFYIDIGAQDPVVDSVSMAFYEQGWRGLHVEPVLNYAERLRSARPDETVIQSAVGEAGILKLFEIVDTGLSTGDPEIAKKHRESGFEIREADVPCVTLASILDRNADRDIHWLKIDVEGMEEQVLRSWSRSPVRPWVVVIESTIPNSQVDTHDHWEKVLVELGYDPAYFDGLNRFYVARAHAELKGAFYCGPNFFDGFSLTSTSPFCSALANKLDADEQQVQQMARALEDAQTQLRQSLVEAERFAADLAQREREAKETSLQFQRSREEVARLADTVALREQEIGEGRSQLQLSREEAQSLAHALSQREQELSSAMIRALQSESDVAKLLEEVSSIYASHSWKITSPLRFVGSIAKRVPRYGIKILGRSRPAARHVGRRAIALPFVYLRTHPRLKALVVRSVDRWPRVAKRLREFARVSSEQTRHGWVEPTPMVAGDINWATYPSSVRRNYMQLLRASATAMGRERGGEE